MSEICSFLSLISFIHAMSQNIFDILDVVELIATHVEKYTDLASCLRVSKVFFHAFGPALYRSMNLELPYSATQLKSKPPLKSLQLNADWIKTLTLHDPFWTDYTESLVLPHLTELRLMGRASMYGERVSGYYSHWVNDPTVTFFTADLDGPPTRLIQRHQITLQRLHLEGFSMANRSTLNDQGVAQNLWAWRAIRDLEQLQELSIADVDIGNTEAAAAFWEICDKHQLKKLEAHGIIFGLFDRLPVSSAPLQGTHRPRRRLQELKLSNVKCDNSSKMRFVDMLVQSEDLRRVTNNRSDDVFRLACESVVQNPATAISPTIPKSKSLAPLNWPQLVSVHIHHRNCNADIILKSISPGLEEFHMEMGELSTVGYQLLLSQHAMTLVHLELSSCSGVTSAMLHGILCTCPYLEHVSGDMICEQDNTAPNDGQEEDPIQGREWVCENLKHWMIPIYVNRRGDKQAIQIRHLEHLERKRAPHLPHPSLGLLAGFPTRVMHSSRTGSTGDNSRYLKDLGDSNNSV